MVRPLRSPDTSAPADSASTRERTARELAAWFHESAGRTINEVETEILADVLANLFGYHLVMLGGVIGTEALDASRISHRVVVATDSDDATGSHLVTLPESLPFEEHSIDVLILPHVLEFSANPHAVLREAERVLVGEGRLVVIGFNPWSLCGAWRGLGFWRGRGPARGQFLHLSRLKDWLSLLGFELEDIHKCSYRPPLRSARATRRLQFLERLGSACWPVLGNVYVVVAVKRLAGIPPMRALPRRRLRVLPGGVAEPTAREVVLRERFERANEA